MPTPRSVDALSSFLDAITGAGLPAPADLIADGQLHRFSSNGKQSDDSGWYVLHPDGIAAGSFGDWRTGFKQTWHARGGKKFTAEERKEYRQKVRAMQRQKEEETKRRRAEAAQHAENIYKDLSPAPPSHPYFQKKGVTVQIRCDADGLLVVPMLDPNGKLASLQFIDGDGEKKFLPGGRVTDCFFPIGKITNSLYVCEGLATAASIHAATGQAVAVAFSASNLKPVAEAMRQKYPALKLIIAGDNDVRDDGTVNIGLTKATEAAAVVGGSVAMPELDGKKCDFNDVQTALGLDVVRKQLEAAVVPAKNEAASNDELIDALTKLNPIEYAQQRKAAAEQLNVAVGAIDQAVRLAKREADRESKTLFPEIEPVTDTVDGNELLNEIAGEIKRYIILPDHVEVAAALWVLHTFAVDAAYVAPILCIESPQKRCGKTQLLKLLSALVHRGLLTENFSLAALYRVMDEYHPTLLIDEADVFMDEQPEIRGIINGGHSRGTRTLRIGGENRDEIQVFDSFGPKAIAGIGKRRDTVSDRSISIKLARRRKDEKVELMRLDRLDYRHLQSRAAGWAMQNMDRLKVIDPSMPEALNDRAQDNWRPLFALATLCGWTSKAVKASLALSDTDDGETVGIMLLEDIQRQFTELEVDRLSSTEIIKALHELEEKPWPEWGKSQKPISQRQLARLLEPFKIKPKTMRINGHLAKGYELDQFTDSFSRYISANSSVTPEQMSTGAGSSGFSSVTQQNHVTDRSVTVTKPVTDENSRKANTSNDCYGATDENPEKTGEEKEESVTAELEYRL